MPNDIVHVHSIAAPLKICVGKIYKLYAFILQIKMPLPLLPPIKCAFQ